MTHPLAIEYRATHTLTPDPRNPRTHSDPQVGQIANSIEAFEFLVPMVVDSKGLIIAGHGRWLASRRLGLATVPVIPIEHLSDDEIRAYRIADNKLAENAGWNEGLLRVELTHLAQYDVSVEVDLTGFCGPERDLLITPVADIEAEPTPPSPPLPSETVTRVGDLYQIGPHKILCGDCREPEPLDRVMDGAQVDMVMADPPFNVRIAGHARSREAGHREFLMAAGELSPEAFQAFLQAACTNIARVSRNGALHYLFMDWRHIPELLGAADAVYDDQVNLCVWTKTNGGMGSFYRSAHELVFVFKVGSASYTNNIELGKHGRHRTNVWHYAGVNAFGPGRDEALAMHPTVKPTALLADAILDATRGGEIVLDPFLGSGTTVLAAHQTGRIGYGVELDPGYVDVALKRLADATGHVPIHVDSGAPFETLAEERLGAVAEVAR